MFSIAKVGYQAQVIPALLAGLALGVIETRLKRIVPDYLYLVVVPVCSLILAVFLAHALIGPFGRMIGDGVALCGTSPDDRQLCSDWRGIVWLPVRPAGDHRGTPDHACY
ncbi:trehalose-specific PTS system EIIBC component [Escherichia coli]|uniref:Trehalose-specific PTS system EIIBC component n=1 Tax=Escherichia coli TaxID=562 RepID=A0A3S4NR99_ECOLX|nr:trehalose-specific PTS system EIIBC component [Escherichia coli]